jgi:hypothetical protein
MGGVETNAWRNATGPTPEYRRYHRLINRTLFDCCNWAAVVWRQIVQGAVASTSCRGRRPSLRECARSPRPTCSSALGAIMIRIKRTYERSDRDDGRRFLVERLLAARHEKRGSRCRGVAEGSCTQYAATQVVRAWSGALGGVSAALQEGIEREPRCVVTHSRSQPTRYGDSPFQRP